MLVKRLNWTIRISVNGGVDANLGIVESYLNRAVKCYHSTLTGGKICPAGDMTSGSNLFSKLAYIRMVFQLTCSKHVVP